jgi:phosphoribosyl 1,2-cyclic phosphate phosphodiesterase
MRSSLYVEGEGGERAVIDTGPEFRLQALRSGIGGLDAVFLTHAHADHIHGLDDLRPLSREKTIPVYGNRETMEEFRERFSYLFKETQRGGGKPRIKTIAVTGPVRVGGLCFTPIPVKHGALDILGWTISEALTTPTVHGRVSMAYLTDCTHIGEDSFRLIGEGGAPALLIVGALRVRPHETHFNFAQALSAAAGTGAREVYLTHICHEHTHREIEEYCKKFAGQEGFTGAMGPAWDGLEIRL